MTKDNVKTNTPDTNASLNADQLMKLSKEDIIKYHFKTASVSKALEKLTNTISDLAARLERTESELEVSKKVNTLLTERYDFLEHRMIQNDKTTTNNSQYLRRRQLEVKNIKSPISNGSALSEKMANLLSLTGQDVTADDLDKCHLLKKDTVIMEFESRDMRDAVVRGRKNLKCKSVDLSHLLMDKVMITESLCPQLAQLDYACWQLKKNKCIHQTWFFNGRLFVVINDGEKKRQITHITDMHELFGKQEIYDILHPRILQ